MLCSIHGDMRMLLVIMIKALSKTRDNVDLLISKGGAFYNLDRIEETILSY
jgi:hypothetical protein